MNPDIQFSCFEVHGLPVYFLVDSIKTPFPGPSWVTQLVRALSGYAKVAGFIHGQGTYKNQPKSA